MHKLRAITDLKLVFQQQHSEELWALYKHQFFTLLFPTPHFVRPGVWGEGGAKRGSCRRQEPKNGVSPCSGGLLFR